MRAADTPSDGVSLAIMEAVDSKELLDFDPPLIPENLEQVEHSSGLGTSSGSTTSVMPKANLITESDAHLTREKDDKLEVNNDTDTLSVISKAVDGEGKHTVVSTNDDKVIRTKPPKNFIVIRHSEGSSFALPWTISQTWKVDTLCLVYVFCSY